MSNNPNTTTTYTTALTGSDGTSSPTAMNNMTTQVIPSQHADYILATALDCYGRRMATVSGDRFVRVWDLQSDGSWVASSNASAWQAHRSAVTDISWAHAEFGSLLATAGADHDCKIWEELQTGNSSRWNLKAALTEARKGVTTIEFAPRHWGLKLATGSQDGCVRIYEAVDIMNLAQWPVAATLQAFNTDTVGCTSISWCTGRFDPPTLVAGGSHLVIYRYSDAARAWQAVLQLPAVTDILDVAWAPNVGRRFHSIAVAAEDALRVLKLSRENREGGLALESTQDIPVTAWRCQWNVTGTVLASSGDAGTVQLYKCSDDGTYQCVSKIQGDLHQVAAAAAASGQPPTQQLMEY
jgi:nucleoporin SEH1